MIPLLIALLLLTGDASAITQFIARFAEQPAMTNAGAVKPFFQRATEDDNSNVRDAAKEALEKIGEVSTGR